MTYPKNVKEIKNLNEFIRKAREVETNKYWSGILYDCSSANYADWTRKESRLKWKREMIQKYLDYKNNKLEEKAAIDWNNYLTPEEVKKFLSKDDKIESAENIIYSKEFQPRYKDLHNSLQAKYKNSWTKKELVQDLNDFYNFGHLITEDYVLRGLQNGKSYDLAYDKNIDKLEKFRDEVIGNKMPVTWIDEHKLEESKHKIEEKSRNELLAKTKSQTITRYNKAQGYKGFYIYDIDTSTLFNKDSTMLIVCKVGDYHSQVEIENVLYWIEYYAEQNENLQINTKNVTQALMDAIDGWNIKVNCECGDFCLEENTKIKLLNGEVVTIKDLKTRFENNEELWVYSTDEKGDFKPGKVNNVWISGHSKEMIKITLDNGEYIITTPNHKYMMRDTTYKQAKHLNIGDSLMPLYFQYTNGYENVKRNSIIYPTRFDSVYKTVANTILSDEIEEAKIRSNEDIIVIHHKDFEKLNNYPSNLYPMGKLEHWYYHAHLGGKNLAKLIEAGRRFWREDPRRFEALEKQKNAAREYQLNMWKNFTSDERAAYIQKSVGKVDKEKLSQSLKYLWENYTEEERQRRLKTNSFITNNPMKDSDFLNSDKMLERNKCISESNHKYMQSLTKKERSNKYGTRKGIKESEDTRLKKSKHMKKYCKTHPEFHLHSKEHMCYMTELSLIPAHTKEANEKRSNTLKQNWLDKLNQVDEQTRKEMLLRKQLENIDWQNIDIKYRITLGKAISIFKYLYLNNIDITEDNYISYKSSKAPKLSTIEDMIGDFESLVNISGFKYNHKVVNIERIVYENPVDVYDIEVEKYHNFYVNAGVMLHNCYRMAYQATKYGYKYGKPENRPAKIRNPNDLGALCFDGNTLIATEKGFKSIKDINVGDYVFTHKGYLKQVTETSNHFANNVIEAHIGSQHIICTDNHPFLLKQKGKIEFKSIKDAFNTSRTFCLNTIPKLYENINIDKNIAFLFGFYMANGKNIAYRPEVKRGITSGVHLSINKDYYSIYKKLLDDMKFEYTFHTNDKNKSSYFYIKSNDLCDFCVKYGMTDIDGKLVKHLNHEVLNWNIDSKIEFLRGFFAGDGQYCTGGKSYLNMKFVNTNKSIIDGIHLILRSLGVHSKCVKLQRKPRLICDNKNISEAKDIYYITITGSDIDLIDTNWLHIVKGKRSGNYKNSYYKAATIANDSTTYFLSRTYDITYLPPQIVYNIGVEGDESYLVSYDMLAVHNCKHLTSMLSNKKWVQQVTSTLMDFIEKNIVQVNKYLNRKAYEELTLPNAEARNLGKQAAYSKVLDRQEFIQEVANAFIEKAGDKIFTININLNDDLQRFINDEYRYSKITPNEFKVIRTLINNYIEENKPQKEKPEESEDVENNENK